MPMFGYEFSTASILDGRKKVDSASDSGCGKHPDYFSVIAYTAETIIPTLDLNEKDHCDFISTNTWESRLFKLLAALLGVFITSMSFVTWSGVLRRSLEP
jgi:hypothetical protein